MADKEYFENFSYCFIPFSFSNEKGIKYFDERLTVGEVWHPVHDEVRYLHKYVSDKLINDDCEKKGCFHYHLDKKAAEFYNLHLEESNYYIAPKKYFNKNDVEIRFSINNVELFAFSTSLGILAFQIKFEDNDIRKIAAAQYYMRKISYQKESEKVKYRSCYGEIEDYDFIKISKSLFRDLKSDFVFDFFFYSAPKHARANFLTYVDVDKKDNYDEDLFYLKWCYHDAFSYDPVSDLEDSQNYVASSDIVWGISPSAAVCLVYRSKERAEFIEGVFQKNFMEQYLFTYILLLHQKYMMYYLLTEIGCADNSNLEALENYKKRCYEFQTDYMFSYITEVPQYQRLYERVSKSFKLEEMFRDVQEPLTRLAEIQRQLRDEEEKQCDKAMNHMLSLLSVLTVFSAIADAAGITANLGWMLNTGVSRSIQVITTGLSLIFTAIVVIELYKLRKKK